jgi:Protein of unknown function DUF262/Putative DNA-binding domain
MAELASQPTSIQSVYAWFREDKLFVNRRYQRKLVWTLHEKQKLIESILKKYPVPAILLAEREEAPGTYEIIDGLQRLHAIVSFIETTFPSLDTKLFDLQHFPNAKSRADEGLFTPNTSEDYLTQREVSTILDYTLALSIMRKATEAEINDVFDRINTYGHRLSDQERRQAGVQNDFSNMVRTIACTLRGDVSSDILPLKLMPSISIDLPMTKHGYEVQADEVFWVKQGILRSTDLRDSMDEQCIADIASSIVGGQLLERSKDALDNIYMFDSSDSNRVLDAVEIYGSNVFAEEFKYCVDEILKVCNEGKPEKLRDIIFKNRTSNPFPSVFAVLLIAFHELIVKDGKKITDYAGIRNVITNLTERIGTGRKTTSPQERRKNIDAIKGLIGSYFITANNRSVIYGNHAMTDIEAAIRRSEIELSDYELKQGLVSLSDPRAIDPNIIDKIIKTICAIANNGPERLGKLIIGVTDKEADASRIKSLDGIEPIKVGKRMVVGVAREAKVLQITMEQYFTNIKEALKQSALSQKLKDSVLSNIDYNAYYGLGLIVITIQPQNELSFVGDDIYWRKADTTVHAASPKEVVSIAQRF